MHPISKGLVFLGIIMIIGGLLVHLSFQHKLWPLPGDIVIEKPHLRVYIPLTTSLILSLILTILFWLGNRFFS